MIIRIYPCRGTAIKLIKTVFPVPSVEDICARKSAELAFALREAEALLFEEKERAQMALNSISGEVLVTELMGGRVNYTT